MGRIMMNGIQYGTGGRPTAEGVTYDNAESGMTATNVQGAVDELSNGLTHLYHVETCSLKNCTISADTYQTFNIPTVEVAGFKPLSIVGFWTDNSVSGGTNTTSVMFNNCNVNDGNVYVRVRNLASSSAKVDIFVRVLYLPRNMSDN